jgi:peptidoglycan/LPS O-acetylase OafA/YrhL
MKRFTAIEGLRGWLAWTVVFSHITQTVNVWPDGIGPRLAHAGGYAVAIFIMVSGFVIAHLVTERPEPYGRYLLRRFMRIFPLFAVTCIVGYYTDPLYEAAVSAAPWVDDQGFLLPQTLKTLVQSEREFFWAHAVAHLTMLHGAISSNLLPLSLYAFNGPGWSLSLEWQFYLIAPAVIMMARDRSKLIWLCLIVLLLEITFEHGLFGKFEQPSFLPGAGRFFALGIASRLSYPMLAGKLRYPLTILLIALMMVPLSEQLLPYIVWLIVMVGLSLDEEKSLFTRAYRCLLESRAATYFGARSYSVYLSHFSATAICLRLWLWLFPSATKLATLFGLTAMMIPVVMIASELLYRGIELPGIALGARLARRVKKGALGTKYASAPSK